MRAMSFGCFKLYCSERGETFYEFNSKQPCRHPANDNKETLTICPDGPHKGKYAYTPCKEKYCPVMQSCKKL